MRKVLNSTNPILIVQIEDLSEKGLLPKHWNHDDIVDYDSINDSTMYLLKCVDFSEDEVIQLTGKMFSKNSIEIKKNDIFDYPCDGATSICTHDIELLKLQYQKEIEEKEKIDLYSQVENKKIISGIKNYFKRKKTCFKKWNLIFGENSKRVIGAIIVPINKKLRPFDKDLNPLYVLPKEKINICWKSQKVPKQFLKTT